MAKRKKAAKGRSTPRQRRRIDDSLILVVRDELDALRELLEAVPWLDSLAKLIRAVEKGAAPAQRDKLAELVHEQCGLDLVDRGADRDPVPLEAAVAAEAADAVVAAVMWRVERLERAMDVVQTRHHSSTYRCGHVAGREARVGAGGRAEGQEREQ